MANRRSRLTRIEEKKALKSTAYYVVLTLGLIIFLAIFGITAISKVALIVDNIAGKDTTSSAGTSTPPPPPQLNTPPDYTKDEKLKLTGRSQAGYTVLIFLNDDKIEVIADASGEFTGLLDLSKGENTIYAKAEDNEGQVSTETKKYIVNLDTETPKLEIISPENEKKYFGSQNKQVKIEGQTEAGARVTVNDRVAIVRSDGKFDFPLTLSDGENIFKIKAVDQAGNETEVELKLYYSS